MAQFSNRRAELAKVHILKKELNLSEDEYRDLMTTVCGVSSSADLDASGREKFIAHLLRLRSAMKFPSPGKKQAVRKKLSPRVGKIFSLWQQLYEAGKVGNRTYKALETWVQGQTKVDKLEWLTAPQQDQCIESLKKWLERGNGAAG